MTYFPNFGKFYNPGLLVLLPLLDLPPPNLISEYASVSSGVDPDHSHMDPDPPLDWDKNPQLDLSRDPLS